MLEKPELQDESIIACLCDAYGLHMVEVAFLPLGADVNTAVYRVATGDGTPYFLKLRGGVFDENSVAIPRFLSEQGIAPIIAPIVTLSHQLHTNLDHFAVTLYPFIEGRHGFQAQMTDRQWVEFGAALKAIHTVTLPPMLMSRVRQETWTDKWRKLVKEFMRSVETDTFAEPTAAALATFLNNKRDVVERLVSQAERLAAALQTQSPPFVLCHSDMHAYNLLIESSDKFYIVDWDDPILAPKERDLMFVGYGMGICDRVKQETMFHQGYGQTEVNIVALAYYRYERIVQDIAAYCEQLLLSDEGGADREEGLRQLTGQFQPHEVIEIALRSEMMLPSELRVNL